MLSMFLLTSILSFGAPSLDAHAPLAPLDEAKVKEAFRNADVEANSNVRFVQYHMPIADTKAVIIANGSTLEEIVLCNTDDDLLQTIQASCPNLKAFSILSRLDNFMEHFTDAGLQAISQFPKLSRLSIRMPVTFSLTKDGMSALLSQQTSLQTLSLDTPMDDSLLAIISQYTNLSSFAVTAYNFTEAALVGFSQSPTLQATLTSLDLNVSDKPLSDALLQGLATFSQLQGLSLQGKWTATNDTISKMLLALPKLQRVQLEGLKVGSDVSQAIASCPNLVELSLDNCSSMNQKAYNALFTKLTSLQVLRLFRCKELSYTHCKLLAKLPLKQLALSGSQAMYNTGLETLCHSKTLQKTLKHLELANNSTIDNIGFAPLTKLALKTLRIVNCQFFNDTSMQLISQGRLASNLEGLELEKVFVSDNLITQLPIYKKLNTLMLSENDAITINGVRSLLQSTLITQRLKKLYLCQVAMTKDMIPLFGNLSQLAVLVVGNPLQLDLITDGGAFFKLPNVVINHARVDLYLVIIGPLQSMISWSQFAAA